MVSAHYILGGDYASIKFLIFCNTKWDYLGLLIFISFYKTIFVKIS